MASVGQQQGRYRVLLIGVGNNTEAEKDSFCYTISKKYNVPLPQLKKIVERCPVTLRKDLSFKKAEFLAKTFKSLGARISVEEKRESPPIFLEFQELAPHRLALESCFLQRPYVGTWSVTGRVKNISDETLIDIWVLVQVFDDFEEFVAFEETPLPINPLPSGQASPFKVIVEGNFSFKKISVGFKNASGQPMSARDKRKNKEWVKAKFGEGRPHSSPGMPIELGERSEVTSLVGSLEKEPVQKEAEIPGDILLSPEREVAPPVEHAVSENYGDSKGVLGGSLPVEPLEIAAQSASEKEDDSLRREESEEALGQEASECCTALGSEKLEKEIDVALNSTEPASEEKPAEGSRLYPSVFQEATRLLEDISERTKKGEVEEKKIPFPWIEHFRDAVKTFHQTPQGPFPIWFEECRKKGEFENSLHALLTILLHCRFDQGSQSLNPLENTQKSFRLIIQPNLLPEEIPILEGTSFASGEIWTDLFRRAVPKVKQIGDAILEKNKWKALDLERLIQVIPHVGIQNGRMAIQWINELLQDVVEIDFSNTRIAVGERLYRVAARLGIVDPSLDHYHGPDSIGDEKIQSFGKEVFPHHPARIEKPMVWMGGGEEQGGHCFPTQPCCNGCLFKAFCPELYFDFDPSEMGMKD